jgi:hypothetical protein
MKIVGMEVIKIHLLPLAVPGIRNSKINHKHLKNLCVKINSLVDRKREEHL